MIERTNLALRAYTTRAVLEDDAVIRFALKAFNGYTLLDGTGGWVNDTGWPEIEDIAVLEILTDDEAHDAHWAALQDLILATAAGVDEDAVLFTLTLTAGTIRRTGGRS